jgi:thiol-disulfide isomerase/thioredoxin
MDNPLLRRRRLLFYLGLGAVGATTAAIAIPALKKSPVLLLAGTASSGTPPSAKSAAAGKTLPEFQGISEWLNSNPLTIAELKGNVILIQFWTFFCINCQRTLPHMTQWHSQYAAQGLKVIGVHTPEFAFERDRANIEEALRQHQITYPVPVDNDFKTWNAYENGYWPHLFLADRQGVMRYDHIGEGAYEETEQMIEQLLAG